MYAYVSRLDVCVCINRKWGALQQFQIKWVVLLLLLLLRRRRRRSKYNHLAITPPSLLVFQETFQPDRSDYVKSFLFYLFPPFYRASSYTQFRNCFTSAFFFSPSFLLQIFTSRFIFSTPKINCVASLTYITMRKHLFPFSYYSSCHYYLFTPFNVNRAQSPYSFFYY